MIEVNSKMENTQANKPYVPSIPYLIFLREAIKGGYKPTLEEKILLKKYGAKVMKTHPRSKFNITPKEILVTAEGN